jgi:hypothetical protein
MATGTPKAVSHAWPETLPVKLGGSTSATPPVLSPGMAGTEPEKSGWLTAGHAVAACSACPASAPRLQESF